MKDTKAFLEDVYPLVEASLDKNLSKYMQCVGRFIEKRTSELYDTVPCSRTYFGTDEINDLFNTLGIDIKVVSNAIDKTYYADIPRFNPAAARDEYSVIMMLIIRYLFLKGLDKQLEISTIYLAFSGKFYVSIHSQMFKYNTNGKYNRHVMEYVVNNELSGKFDLKREKNIFGAIRSVCNTWLKSYSSRFKRMHDEDVVYLIQQLHNRIKSFLRNIAVKYYDVIENKKAYLAYTDDDLSEDNYHLDINSDSLRSEKYVEAAMSRINSSSVDRRLCSYAANVNVKINEVQSIIESIVMDNKNVGEIKELIRLIIAVYMETSDSKDIRNVEFLNKSITPKPNSKDPKVLRQKEIVENWLNENSPAYRKRKSREATRVNYHKSVLIYFTLITFEANK